MSGAEGVLAVNIGVAVLFALGYAIIVLVNPSQRRALWFAVSYLIGMVSPIGDLLAPVLKAPALTEMVSYASFLLATASISISLSLFRRRPPPWIAVALVVAGGLGLRAAIWTTPGDTLSFGALYQAPFIAAGVLATLTVLKLGRGRPLELGLAGVFVLIDLNMAAKPFVALALGSGDPLRNYSRTTYALISQASTGLLLLAAGILMLLIVAQTAIAEQQQASETDPLTGLANRRGFDRQADAALARAARSGLPVAAVMLDLDHFKQVNDRHGHAVGDAVIVGFGQVLRAAAPGAAVIGRLGGEEFALLIEGATADTAWLAAEAIRLRLLQGLGAGLPTVTVSGGVAEHRTGQSLAEALRNADRAAYAAKDGGRNRICRAPSPQIPRPRLAIA